MSGEDMALVTDFEERRAERRKRLGLDPKSLPTKIDQTPIVERLRKIAETRGFAPEPVPVKADSSAPTAATALACGAPHRYRACLRSTWVGAWPLPEWSGDPWSLVVLGKPGRGKTHATTALFNELAGSRGRRAWWLSYPAAISQMKAEFSGEEPGKVSVREKLESDRLLLLDDVGAIRDPTGFANGELLSLVLYRYDREYPTIITSNAESLKAFALIDERIASRLSAGLVVTIAGDDYRRRSA